MVAKMFAAISLCAFVLSVSGTLEEECNILTKLDSLETRLQEQEISLREYQIRLREQEVSLAEKNIRIGDLERSMTEKDTRIGDLERSMANIKDNLNQQAANISELRSTLTATLNEHRTELANLDHRFGPGRQSAFTARVPSSSGSYPYLRFIAVVTNIGYDYSSSTGRFTCQYPGLYFFAVSITKIRSNNDAINDQVLVSLTVNGDSKVYAQTDPQDDSDYGSYETSATFVTRLTAGDYVNIYSSRNSTTMDSKSHFSGFLILPDK